MAPWHFGPRRSLSFLALGVFALLIGYGPARAVATDTLPAELSDAEFWSLTERISEPDGYFKSNSGSTDNLLSNENTVSTVAAALAGQVKPSGVYLGVGPEQNFTYIAAIRPRMAFITDIRRGNLHLHLMYKALFEMSANRAEFVGRLFSRKQPDWSRTDASASVLMAAYLSAPPLDAAGFDANFRAIVDHLTKKHSLPLGAEDIAGIEYVYRNFHRFGPDINYTSSINGRSGSTGSYARIMSAVDTASGAERTYLATEANFLAVKSLETRNLVVPVVGDFAGPKALRALGTYLRDHNATLSAFYVSNVEDYLKRNGVWPKFCANVATMPLDASSTFIRPSDGWSRWLRGMTAETAACE